MQASHCHCLSSCRCLDRHCQKLLTYLCNLGSALFLSLSLLEESVTADEAFLNTYHHIELPLVKKITRDRASRCFLPEASKLLKAALNVTARLHWTSAPSCAHLNIKVTFSIKVELFFCREIPLSCHRSFLEEFPSAFFFRKKISRVTKKKKKASCLQKLQPS